VGIGGTLQLDSNGIFTITEAAGTIAMITVTRSGSTAGQVTVNLATDDGTATNGEDYTSTAGTLTFPAGASVASRSFLIPILVDAASDGSETVHLTLTSPTGGAVSDGIVSVHVATSDRTTPAASAMAGLDYMLVNQTVTFSAGQNKQTVTIPILNDGQIHARRSFTVTLSSPTGGAALGTTTQTTVSVSSVNGSADQRPEYFQTNGGANTPYVDALFRDLLGRMPDASGEAFWVSQLVGGATRFSVALGCAGGRSIASPGSRGVPCAFTSALRLLRDIRGRCPPTGDLEKKEDCLTEGRAGGKKVGFHGRRR